MPLLTSVQLLCGDTRLKMNQKEVLSRKSSFIFLFPISLLQKNDIWWFDTSQVLMIKPSVRFDYVFALASQTEDLKKENLPCVRDFSKYSPAGAGQPWGLCVWKQNLKSLLAAGEQQDDVCRVSVSVPFRICSSRLQMMV